MKIFRRLTALGAVASGAGGILLAVAAPSANASPSVSASNTVVTSPSSVTITAHVDPLNTAKLFFRGQQVAAQTDVVQLGQTLSYTFSATQLANGSYPVEEVEQTAGLGALAQRAQATITVQIPRSVAPGTSNGSGTSSARSGAVSGGSGRSTGSSSGSSSAAGNGAAAPAVLGNRAPASGGNSFGSAYSRMNTLGGRSSVVLPNVAPQNGFQLPASQAYPATPARQTRLASSSQRGTSLTAATWLIGLALGLIMLLTAAHTGAWARKRRLLNTRRPLLGAVATAGAGGASGAMSITDASDGHAGRHRGQRGRRGGSDT